MPNLNVKLSLAQRPVKVKEVEFSRVNLDFENPYTNIPYLNWTIPQVNKLGLISGQVACIDKSEPEHYKVCTKEEDQALGLFCLTHGNHISSKRIDPENAVTTIIEDGLLEIEVYEVYEFDTTNELTYATGDKLYCSPFGLLTNQLNLTSESRPLAIVVRPPSGSNLSMEVRLLGYATNPNYDDSRELEVNPSSLPFLSITDYEITLRVGTGQDQVAAGDHNHNLEDIVSLIDSNTNKVDENILPESVFGISVNQYATVAMRDASTPLKGDVAKVVADPDPNNNSTYFYDGGSWVEITTSNKVDFDQVNTIQDRTALTPTEGDLAKVVADANPSNNGTYAYSGSSWVKIGILRPINVIRFDTLSDRDTVFTNPNEGDMAIVNNDPVAINNRVYVYDQDTAAWYSTGDGVVNPIDVTPINTLADRASLSPSEGDIAIVLSDPQVSNNGAYIWDENFAQWYKIESTTVNWSFITNIPPGLVIDEDYFYKKPLWDIAYDERRQWDGGATNLDAALGRSSLGLGDAATKNVGSGINDVASAIHQHNIADVVSLQEKLDLKSDIVHNHDIVDIVSLPARLSLLDTLSHNPATVGNGLNIDSDQHITVDFGVNVGQVAEGSHQHPVSDIVSLPEKLDDKASLSDLHDPVTTTGSGLLLIGQDLELDFGTNSGQVAEGDHQHPLVDIIGLLDNSQSKINPALLPSLSPVRIEVVNTLADRDALSSLEEGVFSIVTSDPVTDNNGTYIYDTENSWVKSSGTVVWDDIQNKPADLLYESNVIDNLTSISPTNPLSANQGRVLNESILGKADRPVTFTIGNIGVFDSQGDLDDSGTKPSDFEPADNTILKEINVVDDLLTTDVDAPLSANQGYVLKGLIDDANVDLSSKIDKVPSADENNIAIFTSGGGVQDSGIVISSLDLHDPVTINPLSDPYLSVDANQQITLGVGENSNQVAAGNHSHDGLIVVDGTYEDKLVKTSSDGLSIEYVDPTTLSSFNSYVMDPFEGEKYVFTLETEKEYKIMKVGVRCFTGSCDVDVIYNATAGADLDQTTNTSITSFSNVDNSTYREANLSSSPVIVPSESTIGFELTNVSGAEKFAIVVHYK